jgi:hypothetical protein
MPENGEIPLSGDPRVDAALQRIRGKFRDLEDATVVQAHLEKRAGERIKEHAKWLVAHQEAKRLHEERMAQLDLKMLDINDKVNFLIDREMRREGGPESRGESS